MKRTARTYFLVTALAVFIGLPMLLYILGDTPRRSLLKETISVLTLLSFSLMLCQFFLARSNAVLLELFRPRRIQKVHKVIAYGAVGVFLVHPFLIVLPRYFEAGVKPWDALITMLTSFDSLGVLLGLAAWVLMVVILVTSMFRIALIKRFSMLLSPLALLPQRADGDLHRHRPLARDRAWPSHRHRDGRVHDHARGDRNPDARAALLGHKARVPPGVSRERRKQIMTRSQDASAITRREFLALSAGTAAAVALGAAWAQNNVELDPAAVFNADHATDVLVIGGGMAGLFAAVKAHDAGAGTMIVSKGRLGSSGMTPFAKGFFTYRSRDRGRFGGRVRRRRIALVAWHQQSRLHQAAGRTLPGPGA